MDFARHYIQKVRQWFETVPRDLQDSDQDMWWTGDEEGTRLTRRAFHDHVVKGSARGKAIVHHAGEWLENLREEGIWDGVVCEDCDLPIEIDYDPSTPNQREDSKLCRRTRPFCLNLTYHVDWRERAYELERSIKDLADWVENQSHKYGVSATARHTLAALIRLRGWKR